MPTLSSFKTHFKPTTLILSFLPQLTTKSPSLLLGTHLTIRTLAVITP
jgi:hypothetical protein